MNILVTGGAGYIGSHTCKQLRESGFNPIVYDNLSRGNRWAVKWGEFVKGDILNLEKLNKVFEKYKPEAVLHFAAFAYVGESVNKPDIYYRNNVIGSLNLLDTMIKFGVTKFVFSSSCATYGIPKSNPVSEDHNQDPINPYGRTKLVIEKILEDYSSVNLINYVSLRYFNAAGADPEGEIGECHDPEPHLIPLILYNALGEKDSITIFGTDYPTKDGTCIRDYTHVSDLANAHVKALQYLNKDKKSIALNLGNQIGYSIREVIDTVERVTNKKINFIYDKRRPGDPAELVGDYSNATKILDWKPEYNLEKIIETAWKWHIHNERNILK